MHVLVCGSRHWTDGALILETLRGIEGVSLVIHGAAPGADALTGEAARGLGIPVLAFHADWPLNRPVAGPLQK